MLPVFQMRILISLVILVIVLVITSEWFAKQRVVHVHINFG